MKIISCILLLLFNFTLLIADDIPENMKIDLENSMLTLQGQNELGLYDINSLDTIHLQFDQPDYWTQLKNNYNSKTDIPATLTYKGTVYQGVGIRFRGQTSYMKIENEDKKSFNISLDYQIEDQDIEGYQTLNLVNSYDDPSFMREALYSFLSRRTIPTARVNYVNLFINGQNWGVYVNVQQLNKDFLEEWFTSKDGCLWRAEAPDTVEKKVPMIPIDGEMFPTDMPDQFNGSTPPPPPPPNGMQADTKQAFPGFFGNFDPNNVPPMMEPPGGGKPGGNHFGAGKSSLNYLSDDILPYTSNYTLKSDDEDERWAELAEACKQLNQLPSEGLYDELNQYLDIDRSLWQIANEIAFTDDDGYVNKGGMDYYVYYDDATGRITPVDYDANSTFLEKKITFSPFYRETDTAFALIYYLFKSPELKQRYIAHLRTIINNSLQDDVVADKLEEFRVLIDQNVRADTKNIYSYSEFNAEIFIIKNFVESRRNNLLNYDIISAEAPEFISHNYKSPNGEMIPPFADQKVTVHARASHSSGVNKLVLYYGTGLDGVFERVEMIKNDNIYSAQIPAHSAGTYVRYYIEAIADNQYNTAAYLPEGAEHDVFIYQVQATISNNSDLVINEVLAKNDNTLADPQGDYDDWIEIFNNGSEAIDLSGKYISDKTDNLTKWQFPEETSIQPGEYIIIWADEDGKDEPGYHANFKLSASGELVILVDSDENGNAILDSVNFGDQDADISWGRFPNAIGEFQAMPPTPGAYNDKTSSVRESEEISLNIHPNPFSDNVNVVFQVEEASDYLISIYSTKGQLVKIIKEGYFVPGTYTINWDGTSTNQTELTSGVYYLKIESTQTTKFRKLIKLK